jgi:bifunctional non-homologous end joining protein LigD
MREAARLLRDALSALKLASHVKTSGGQGLHLVVPIAPRFGWDLVRPLARAIVEHMAEAMPERFVARSGAEHRVGKVFIDYLRNGFGATTVCAWSARARPGLGISVPIAWDELDELDSAAHWTVRNAHDRLAIGNTPWATYARSRQGLAFAAKALGLEIQEMGG